MGGAKYVGKILCNHLSTEVSEIKRLSGFINTTAFIVFQ
jgi:hypothetical protein